MPSFFEQILTLVTTSPGNLAYHMVVSLTIAAVLVNTLRAASGTRPSGWLRVMIGLGVLLALRLGMFVAAGLANQDAGVNPALLPAADRAFTLLSLIVIVWLWAFPNSQRAADAATLLLGLLTLTLLALSLTWSAAQPTPQTFNESWSETIWQSASLAVTLLGALILLVGRPAGWGVGLAMLALSFGGHLLQLVAPLAGNYPAAVRLAQMAAYPLLLALPGRFSPVESSSPGLGAAVAPSTGAPHAAGWLELAAAESAPELLGKAAQQLGEQWGATLSLLLGAEDERGHFPVLAAYQTARKTYLKALPISGGGIPVLANAIKRQRPLRLVTPSQSPDLLYLNHQFGLENAQVLAAPLITNGDLALRAVVLIADDEPWSREQHDALAEFCQPLARLLARLGQAFIQQTALQAKQTDLDEALAGIQRLQAEVQLLRKDAETTPASSTAERVQADSLKALLAAQEESQATIAELQAEIERLHAEAALQRQAQAAAVEAPASEVSPAAPEELQQLEEELRLSLMEVAQLRKMLSEADQRILELNRTATSGESRAVASEYQDMITSIAQDLRQPMSSILGYTDLLLGESVGILGALQRKFMERIKASTQRMGGLIEEIIQLTTLERERREIVSESVDLSLAIDEALAATSSRIREKNILLRVDLPAELPHIQADQDAIQQVLIHLLQNAGSVTPPEGEITLSARIEQDEKHEQGYVLLQVADSGGGIPAEELPRVFSRLYRNEETPIPGVGENSMGLAIAKALVEALYGRIWVDSLAERGATYSVLLPLNQTASTHEQQA